MSNKAVLLAFSDELLQGEEIVKKAVLAILEPETSVDHLAKVKNDCSEFVTQIGDVAESADLNGLKEIMLFIDTNLARFFQLQYSEQINQNTLNLLQGWSAVFSNFLRDCNNEQYISDLHRLLNASDWLQAIDSDKIGQIIRGMQDYAGGNAEKKSNGEASGLTLTPADISIEISDDISPNLLMAFQEELPQCVEELLQSIKNIAEKKITPDDIKDTRRVAHTLKGAANMVGVAGIANMAHLIEEIFDLLSEKRGFPSEKMGMLLSDTVSCLGMMADAALNVSEPPSQIIDRMKKLIELKGILSGDDCSDYVTLEQNNVEVSSAVTSEASIVASTSTGSSAVTENAEVIDALNPGVAMSGSIKVAVVGPDKFIRHENKEYIKLGEKFYRAKYLSELLGIKKHFESSKTQPQIAILVTVDDTQNAVLIDEIVEKSGFVATVNPQNASAIGDRAGGASYSNELGVPAFDLEFVLGLLSKANEDHRCLKTEQPIRPARDILIVDDSSSARRRLSQVVVDAGYNVRTAVDGTDAIDAIRKKKPDMVLTDLEMPNVNGFELVNHLRSADSTRDLPIVMVSSRSTEKHKFRAAHIGVSSYITKPFTDDELLAEMNHLFER